MGKPAASVSEAYIFPYTFKRVVYKLISEAKKITFFTIAVQETTILRFHVYEIGCELC